MYTTLYCPNFKKHPILWFAHPNRNWKWISLSDSNSRFQAIQTKELELQAISISTMNLEFPLNSILEVISVHPNKAK
jgi:hypothetical protein